VSVTLQFVKFVSTTEMLEALETCTAPPRTARFEILAPPALQFSKLLCEITNESAALRASTANAPPLLEDDKPVVPEATLTVLLMKVHMVTLKLVIATLFEYVAPPPPFASPGRTDAALENAEHWEKLDLDIRTVRLKPVALRSAPGGKGFDRPSFKSETWGE
jgi:hypothetical protein